MTAPLQIREPEPQAEDAAASAKQAVQSVDVDALLKGAGEMAGEAQEELEKATEGAGDAASDAVDEATEGLKKLLE